MTSLSNNLSDKLKATLKTMPKITAMQWAGNLVLMLFAALWLQIPDSHIWQFALSITLSLLIMFSLLWLYAKTTKTLSNLNTPATTSLISRMLILLVFAALWLLLQHPIAWGREKEQLLAGFWNSKLPPHMRYFFTYNRLLLWQERFYTLLQLFLPGLLIPLALTISARGLQWASLKRATRVYLTWSWWLLLCIAGAAGIALTRTLINWTPGKALAAQTISLLLRLGLAYTADILLWCFILTFASVCLSANESSASSDRL